MFRSNASAPTRFSVGGGAHAPNARTSRPAAAARPLGASPPATATVVPSVVAAPRRERETPRAVGYHGAVSEFKRRLIEATLHQASGNRTHAARALGLQRTYLLRYCPID
jgi:DNA-binding NtrC family response regulator